MPHEVYIRYIYTTRKHEPLVLLFFCNEIVQIS
nr:MAG TPA: hypothetical protein [Caudoviricetes sp.]